MLAQIDTTKAGVDLMADVRERFAAALEKAGVPEEERMARMDAFQQELVRVNATDAAAAMIDRTILSPAVETIDREFKDQPLVDAQLRQSLADLYQSIGLHAAAMPLQESALADTLAGLDSFGALLQAQGRFDEAEPYIRDSLESRRRVLGEEHPETLSSVSRMGGILWSQGKLDAAEPYFREALDKHRRMLGEAHPNTLAFINNMGVLLYSLGRLSEAEPYFLEALDKHRQMLGDEHPNTLGFVNNVGNLLVAQGKLAEAEPYYREALEKRRRVLGEVHPDTLTSIDGMGALLHRLDNLIDAEALYREALEKRRRVLGEEHPHTLASINRICVLLRTSDRNAEAVELLAHAEVAARRTFTGGDESGMATMLTLLGGARVSLGYDADRFALAEKNLLEASAILREASGTTPGLLVDCFQELVDLYVAWHAAEPEKGYDAKASEWRAKLDAAGSGAESR
jgi:tetratricopeptide (TPR) repeat protein